MIQGNEMETYCPLVHYISCVELELDNDERDCGPRGRLDGILAFEEGDGHRHSLEGSSRSSRIVRREEVKKDR